jgi:DnaJ-class molecular chaperone
LGFFSFRFSSLLQLIDSEKRKIYDQVGMDYVNGNAPQQAGINRRVPRDNGEALNFIRDNYDGSDGGSKKSRKLKKQRRRNNKSHKKA